MNIYIYYIIYMYIYIIHIIYIYIYVFACVCVWCLCVFVHSVMRKTIAKLTSQHSPGKKSRSILGTPSTREEEKVTQQPG